MEHSPFCERDFRAPNELETHDEKGDFVVKVKKENVLHQITYASHPFDVVGWDGYNFPYAFNIKDFEPITGRVHLPPPIHQTFEAHNFVVCSFVPRLYDYHPEAVPAPYNHSNIDSDEVLYYVEGNFMSRKGIERGSFTLHPGGLPHGPHPGTVEKSIGAKETEELAVMLDTFKPLFVTEEGKEFMDKKYPMSWTE
jgi:homogentisate 1,2-dioxygenase